MSRTFIDIHILQTVPPSNLNRDDTGSPKTAVYGGVRRARVSSQAWKRATRREFQDVLDPADLGIRTKRVVELIATEIERIDADLTKQAEDLGEKAIRALGLKVEKPKAKTKPDQGTDTKEQVAQSSYLLFLSARQVRRLAELSVEAVRAGAELDKKAARAAADQQHSVDLALFGRMVADAPDLNVDAAAQVAHAISVHAVDNEYDYFTAVDDKSPEDTSGAGMIGTVEFNSSTLYRYATVNADELTRHLGGAAPAGVAVGAFVRAFVTSMPTGKQNTFANRTLPEAIVVTVRADQPVNLVGAFEEAVVRTEESTRAKEASRRLADYALDLERAYVKAPVAAYVVRLGSSTEPLASLGEEVTFDELVTNVESVVGERLRADQ